MCTTIGSTCDARTRPWYICMYQLDLTVGVGGLLAPSRNLGTWARAASNSPLRVSAEGRFSRDPIVPQEKQK